MMLARKGMYYLWLYLLIKSMSAFVHSPDCRPVGCQRSGLPIIEKRKLLSLCNGKVPSVEELTSDSFMQQVSHAEKLVQLLADVDCDSADSLELLKAQLSHSDGIRGFFVTYLTMLGDKVPADRPQIPPALLKALTDCSNEKELVSLACMNVIMPTAMITMHKDQELSQQSQKTAERGVRVLKALLPHKPLVQEECQAILAVAQGTTLTSTFGGSSKVIYWEKFFEKWGYQDVQKRDIAQAIQSIFS